MDIITFETPIKLKSSKAFIEELSLSEWGRYEDACCAREAGNLELIVLNRYDLTVNDFIHRHKTIIELRTSREAEELWYALTTGTTCIDGDGSPNPARVKHANKLLDQIRDTVKQTAPDLVMQYPRADGF